MDYYDNPSGPGDTFRSELAPTGLFLGFAGAIAAFVLPAMGSLESATKTLNFIQTGFASTIDILTNLEISKGL